MLGHKTKCESYKEARQRTTKIVDKIELQLSESGKSVIVGHGFLNRMIKKELSHRGWFFQSKGGNGFLSKMTFKTEQQL